MRKSEMPVLKILLSTLLTLFFQTAQAAIAPNANSKVMTFKDWKGQKILAANEKIKFLKSKIQKISQESPQGSVNNPLTSEFESELNQELWNLDVARDLNFQDYLAIYVKNLSDKQRLQELAALLSKEEVAELLKFASAGLGGHSLQPQDRAPSRATQKP